MWILIFAVILGGILGVIFKDKEDDTVESAILGAGVIGGSCLIYIVIPAVILLLIWECTD